MSQDHRQALAAATRVVSSLDYAAAVLLIYDYCLTFDREKRLVWKTRWSFGKILFLLTRYPAFVDTALTLTLASIRTNATPKTCGILIGFTGWLEAIGIGIAEAILVLRTWAIWGSSPTVLWILGAIFVVMEVATAVFLQIFLLSIKWGPTEDTPGCNVESGSPILFGAFALIMLFETVVMIFTAIKAVQHALGSSLPFTFVVYRDGIFFYVYLFGMSAINVVFLLVLPPLYGTAFTPMQRVLHSILSARLLLNLREASLEAKHRRSRLSDVHSAIVFRPGAENLKMQPPGTGNQFDEPIGMTDLSVGGGSDSNRWSGSTETESSRDEHDMSFWFGNGENEKDGRVGEGRFVIVNRATETSDTDRGRLA